MSHNIIVIVAAWNNGRYLSDALASLKRQKLPASEIIYADDGSTDNSVEVAQNIPGVRVLRFPHRGAVATRNAGYAAAGHDVHHAPYVFFADGDDIYSADVLSAGVAALEADKSAAVAYPNLLNLEAGLDGYGTSMWPGRQEWRRDELAEENYAPSCSVVRRCAFEAAGRWEEIGGTYWDWWLWLRITRQGWRMTRMPAEGYMLYRRYGTQNSVLHRPDRMRAYAEITRRMLCSVFTPFAPGRWKWTVPMWRENLLRSGLRLESAQLIVLDNTSDPAGRRAILDACESLAPRAYTVLAAPQAVDGENRHRTGGEAVSELLCKFWGQALAAADGDWLWSLEDDVRVREGACSRLISALRPHVGIVGSPAVSRWRRPHEVMVYRLQSHRPFDLAKMANGRVDYRDMTCAGVESVGALSCCSAVIRRTVFRDYCPMTSPDGDGRWSGWEYSLMRHCRDVGRDVLCHWDTPVDHMVDEKHALTVEDWRRAMSRPGYYDHACDIGRVKIAVAQPLVRSSAPSPSVAKKHSRRPQARALAPHRPQRRRRA